jgi:uncharacterized protein
MEAGATQLGDLTKPVNPFKKWIKMCSLFINQRALVYQPPDINEIIERPEHPLIKLKDNLWGSGWIFNPEKSRAVVLFSGNTDHIYDHRGWMESSFPNHTIYMMPYRGFSGNPGKPTEKNIKNDAITLINKIKQHHDVIDVVGRSLGTGVAIHIAAIKELGINKLALLTPYDSLVEVARYRYPWAPVNLLLRDKFENIKDAPHVKCPVLVITAEKDTVVPPIHAERLMSYFSTKIDHLHIKKANHTTVCFKNQTHQKMLSFFMKKINFLMFFCCFLFATKISANNSHNNDVINDEFITNITSEINIKDINYLELITANTYEPHQRIVKKAESINWGKFLLTPRATFNAGVRLVYKKEYIDKSIETAVSPVDFAVAWGPMNNDDVLNKIILFPEKRWVNVAFNGEYTWEKDILLDNFSNIHIIPASRDIHEKINNLPQNINILITGYLVDVSKKNWVWKTSLSRNDRSQGACEILFLTDIKVLN